MDHIEERLATAMTLPMEAVFDSSVAVRPSPSLLASWDLPVLDRAALLEWGLPDDEIMTPRFQSHREPALIPNVAGELERRWVDGSERLYDLGFWGGHELTPHMGVAAGAGRVLAIRERPMTTAELHPQVQASYPNLYHPAVDFINTSLRQLVEVAWRWRAAVHVLREVQEPADTDSAVEVDAFFTRLYAYNQTVLRHMARLDEGIDPQDESGLWAEVVLDPGC